MLLAAPRSISNEGSRVGVARAGVAAIRAAGISANAFMINKVQSKFVDRDRRSSTSERNAGSVLYIGLAISLASSA